MRSFYLLADSYAYRLFILHAFHIIFFFLYRSIRNLLVGKV